jgi:transmembrane sensor
VRPEIAAEAAVWVTRLHGPDRSRRMERECLAWQARSAAHREAFERCTDTWEDVPRVSLANAFAASGHDARVAFGFWSGRVRWIAALGGVVLVVLGIIGHARWDDRNEFATGVGEQQQVLLGDGTRMTLNTETRARVDFDSQERAVSVEEGEAVFEVAKDARRPFVVRVGGSEVVAVGTVFAVRLTANGQMPGALAVTLLEGLVSVRPAAGAKGLAPERTLQMQPGERVQLSGADGSAAKALARVDRPNLAQIVAWRHNEAVFDNASLNDALAEMNRYSRTQIVLVDVVGPQVLRVSGIYRIGDAAGFASAVAALHGLRVEQRDGRLELKRPQ